MDPVDLTAYDSTIARARTFIGRASTSGLRALPALVYADGTVMTEWTLSEAERSLIARGENVRLWIRTGGRQLQPVRLDVTSEDRA